MNKEKEKMRFFKIKIAKDFLVISLVIGGLILFYLAIVENKIKKEIFIRMETICVLKKEQITDVIRNNANIIASIAKRKNLRIQLKRIKTNNKKNNNIIIETNRILSDILSDLKFFADNIDDLFVIDNKGKIIASTKKKNIGKNMEHSEVYLQGCKYFYQGYLYFENKALFYQFSAPIFDLDKKNILGIIGIKARPHRIINVLTDYTGLNKEVQVFLGKRKKEEMILFAPSLLQSGEMLQITIPLSNFACAKAMKYVLKGKSGIIRDINFQGKKTLCAYQYIPDFKWGLVVELDGKKALTSIKNLRIQIGLVFLSIIFLFNILFRKQKAVKENQIKNQETNRGEVSLLPEEFNRFNRCITSTIEWEKLLSVVIREAIKLINADGGILALTQKDKEKKTLVFPYYYNVSEDLIGKIVSEKERLIGYMTSIKEKFLYIDNYSQYDKEGFPWFARAGVESLLIVPLLLEKKEDLGFLILFGFTGQNQFLEKSVYILANLADNIAFAIHNANRFKQIILINKDLQHQQEDVSGANKKIIETEKLVLLRQVIEGIGHDLRSPLATIKNAVYLIKKRMKDNKFVEKDLKINRYLQMIDEKINVSDKIMRDVSVFCEIDKYKPMRVKIDLIVERALSSLPSSENIKIIKELNLSRQEVIISSVPMIHAFMNIILNAYQSMPDGGELKIQTREVKTEIEVVFSDTGIGIDLKNIEKIFELYYNTKGKMLGLGLAIAKAAIENNNGTISVESKVNKGTVFIVRFPKV